MASVRDGLERMAALFRERGKVAKRLLAIDRELAGIGEGLTGVTTRQAVAEEPREGVAAVSLTEIPHARAIRMVLLTDGAMSGDQVAKTIQVAETTVLRSLKALERAGSVMRDGTRGRNVRWQLRGAVSPDAIVRSGTGG